ncbi:MAG: GPW/gp25 family protein [Alphaproteobacteria bacterium]|nr:GPW/gp25 family protein [Alphaproteobacteria bacterium]
MMSRPFLGTGWAFPTELDENGQVITVSGEEAVRQSIVLILSTALGERVMRPEFGCGLHDQIFAPAGAETTGRLIGSVQEAVGRWEPRVELNSVRVEADPTEPTLHNMELTVTIRSTNSRFNMVFPFYLDYRTQGV